MAIWGKGAGRSIPTGIPNKIQTADIGRKLRARLGLTEADPVPALSPELVAVVLVDDVIAESDILTPRIRPASGVATAGLSASTGRVVLSNPAASGVIVHLQYMIVSSSVAGVIGTFRANGALGVPGTTLGKGWRFMNATGIPAATVLFDANNTTGAVMLQTRIATASIGLIPFDHVIDESFAFSCCFDTATTANVDVTFFWTEENKKG